MKVDVGGEDLRQGVLGLVIALTEIIKETLKLQALKRMEAGSLTDEELERLGEALADLDEAFERVKTELGVAATVRNVRDGLDRAVEEVVSGLLSAPGTTH